MILKIFSDNQQILEFIIEDNKEYILGRHQDCDIQLDVKNGISRRHLKLIIEGNQLKVSLISNLGELNYKGAPCNEILVSNNERFSIGFFDFLLEHNDTLEEIYDDEEIEEGQDEEYFEDDLITPSSETPNELFDSQKTDGTLQANPEIPSIGELADTQQDSRKDLPQEKSNNFELVQDESINSEFEYETSNEKPDIQEESHPQYEESIADQAFNESLEQPTIEDDNTMTSNQDLQVFLHIISKSTNKIKRTYELNGNNWIIGRDEKNSLQLPYPFISRKHFELVHTSDGFYISDLESGNGTKVNGRKLPPKEHIRIYSDDLIEIKSLKIQIELVNQEYSKVIDNIDFEDSYDENSQINSEPLFVEEDFFVSAKPKKSNKTFVRFLIVALLVGMGYFKLAPQNKKIKKDRKIANIKKEKPKEIKVAASDPNKIIIMDIYNLANNYYNDQEHIECISELDRLHNLTPEYKNSKKLLKLCQSGLELKEEIRSKNEREKQAKEILKKTKDLASQCRKNFKSFKSKTELNVCLDKLLLFDPSHPVISELNANWDAIETQKEQQKQVKATNIRNKNKAESLYKQARDQHSSKNYPSAIEFYNKYINHPSGDKLKKQESERNIASIRKELKDLEIKTVSLCENSFNSGNLKSTVNDCTSVLRKYPNNSNAKKYRSEALGKLRRKAKDLYTDANLEESLGNISSAKTKWKEILGFHVNSDEYYKKAKRKLKKYNDL